VEVLALGERAPAALSARAQRELQALGTRRDELHDVLALVQ
jgi:hypothetical protein